MIVFRKGPIAQDEMEADSLVQRGKSNVLIYDL